MGHTKFEPDKVPAPKAALVGGVRKARRRRRQFSAYHQASLGQGRSWTVAPLPGHPVKDTPARVLESAIATSPTASIEQPTGWLTMSDFERLERMTASEIVNFAGTLRPEGALAAMQAQAATADTSVPQLHPELLPEGEFQAGKLQCSRCGHAAPARPVQQLSMQGVRTTRAHQGSCQCCIQEPRVLTNYAAFPC